MIVQIAIKPVHQTMQKPKRIPLLASGLISGTLLIQPVCAAICPKGKGACPYPGKCFLYTDADSNAICDYTTRTSSGGSGSSGAVPAPSGSVTMTPADPSSSSSIATNFFDLIHISPLVAGILIFLVTNTILIWIFSTVFLKPDTKGRTFRSTAVLLATTSFFSLGVAMILVSLLMGETSPGMLFAIVYMLSGVPLTAGLWMKNRMTRMIALSILSISALTGFIFLAPIMPTEFNGLIGVITGYQSLTPGILAILIVLGLALIFGRVFCAYLCPVGTVQELASKVPGRKVDIHNPRIPETIRFIVFITAVAGGVSLLNIMGYTGVYDFFRLAATAGFFLFAGLIVVSVFIYRPVCRFLCPYGVLFSILSHISRYWLRRTDACINCRKCEKACPVHCAQKDASRRECYLCGRCIQACPVPGAIAYKKP